MPITVEDLKNLSPKMRMLIVLGICSLLGYFYYMFFFQGILEKRIALDAKLTELRQQVVEKEKVAAQTGRYAREIDSLKESFKTALLKLPDQREIPALLDAVALAGKKFGVDFLLFEPKPPEKKPPEAAPAALPKPADAKTTVKPPKPAGPEKFYDEIPVNVQISAGFHNTLSFFDQVGRLPRIINIERIEMVAPAADAKGRGRTLKTSCVMKTYMFAEKKKP
jgi:type IV pilus assembly protein PilO